MGAVLAVAASGVALYMFSLAGVSDVSDAGLRNGLIACSTALFVVLGLATAYLYASIRSFAGRARRILDEIRQGAFRGAKADRRDELHSMLFDINDTLERLRTVDRLRARRVALAFRLVRLLHMRMNAPAVLVDLANDTATLNEPFCRLYEIEQDVLNVNAILNMATNEEFRDLYQRALFNTRRPEIAEVWLALPHGRSRRLRVEVVPLRGEDEGIARAVILASPIEGEPASQAPGTAAPAG
jgi:hypothetical protein